MSLGCVEAAVMFWHSSSIKRQAYFDQIAHFMRCECEIYNVKYP